MFLLPWLRLDIDDVKRLRINVVHVPSDRLHRGKCVRGRVVATCLLYVQRRLRVQIDNDNCMRGLHKRHRQLRCVWCRCKLRREWRPNGIMCMLPWLRLDCDDVKRLRVDVVHVLYDRLQRGQCVRRWVCSASRLYVQRWLRIRIDHDNRVCG